MAWLIAKVSAAPAEEENPSPFPSTPGMFFESILSPSSSKLFPASLPATGWSLRTASRFTSPSTRSEPSRCLGHLDLGVQRRGVDRNAVVIGYPQFPVFHPVILHERLHRVGDHCERHQMRTSILSRPLVSGFLSLSTILRGRSFAAASAFRARVRGEAKVLFLITIS